MLEIQRIDDGRLRLSDRRRSGVAAGEAEARRTLYHWGYTDLTINKALAELRQAEGTLPPATPWRVIRPTDRVHDTAAGEDAAGKAPRKRRAKAAATLPTPEAAPAKPESAPPRAKQPAAAVPAAPPADAPPAKKRARGRKQSPVAEVAAVAPPPEDPAPAAAPAKRRRATKAERATRDGGPASPPPAPEPAAAPGLDAGASPVTRARRPRTRAAPPPATPNAAAPGPEPDPLARARSLLAEGTRALRELEAATLPFARGPWTELRTQAEHIVACLTRKG